MVARKNLLTLIFRKIEKPSEIQSFFMFRKILSDRNVKIVSKIVKRDENTFSIAHVFCGRKTSCLKCNIFTFIIFFLHFQI